MIQGRHLLSCIILLAGLAGPLSATQSQSEQQAAAQKVPVMDGEAGPCSLQVTVTDPDGKPVYAATIKVHMAYGFGGIRRLDLEAGTNADGKAKFVGLPSRVRRPPLEFKASKDQMEGVATYDPAKECQAQHDIRLHGHTRTIENSLLRPFASTLSRFSLSSMARPLSQKKSEFASF
jgi:hypothetical protein